MSVNETEIIKCYSVMNTDCGKWLMHDSIESATEIIFEEVGYIAESMDTTKEDYELLTSLTSEQIIETLKSCKVGKEIQMANGLIKVKVSEMYRHEFDQLPEFDGC